MIQRVSYYEVDMGYDVNIKRLEVSTLIDLQGDPAIITHWIGNDLPPFPERPNTATNAKDISIYWVGSSRWLLRADVLKEQELLSRLRLAETPTEISLVQVSDTLQFFSIKGPDAREIISIASAIDHHPSVFPFNGASYTEIFGMKGLLIRKGEGFEIGVERSYGDMVEDFLLRIK
ncbi:MAG: sarcosine oxidase subunit gamma [Gammaproteobacteria bacterium]|nr:sarcosine oxidase subunit gamma [Gammaproteobacteria bacterium]